MHLGDKVDPDVLLLPSLSSFSVPIILQSPLSTIASRRVPGRVPPRHPRSPRHVTFVSSARPLYKEGQVRRVVLQTAGRPTVGRPPPGPPEKMARSLIGTFGLVPTVGLAFHPVNPPKLTGENKPRSTSTMARCLEAQHTPF